MSQSSRSYSATIAMLEPNILLYFVFPHLSLIDDLLPLARTCKSLYNMVYNEDFWNNFVPKYFGSVDICISPSCKYGCGRIAVTLPTITTLLLHAPMKKINLHMPLNMLVNCLSLVYEKKKKTVTRMTVKLVEEDTPYTSVLPSSMVKVIDSLEEIILYNWPSQKIKYKDSFISSIDYCEDLLSICGQSLLSLEFEETSPYGIFTIIMQYCPKMTNLHIAGPQSSTDLLQYTSNNLKALKLYHTNLFFTGNLNFPNLTRLEYINTHNEQDSFHRPFFIVWNNTAEIYSMISALPTSLTELVLRVNCSGQYINDCIVLISEHLHLLETLIVNISNPDVEAEIEHDVNINNNVTVATMNKLLHGCPLLEQIELLNEPNSIENNAFLILRDFTRLHSIKLLYDDNLLDSALFKSVLSKSVTLEEIIFSDYSYEVEEWAMMESKVEKIAQEFPAVLIELVTA